MSDLLELNRRIAEHWLGRLDAEQEAYLGHVAVCIGQLDHSAADFAQILTYSNHNPLPVARLNRRYLRFARLAAKEVAAGRPEMLVALGIDLDQAALFRRLTDEEVDRLAFGWNAPIVQFADKLFRRGAALHERAARQHAAALVATRARGASGNGM
jgi:tryptophanyl-tRNA synthetase